jgi:hypothetical protein
MSAVLGQELVTGGSLVRISVGAEVNPLSLLVERFIAMWPFFNAMVKETFK